MSGGRLRAGWRAVTGQCGHNIPDRMAFSMAHRRRAGQIAGMSVDEALALPDYGARDLNYDVRVGWVAVDDSGTRAPRRRPGQHTGGRAGERGADATPAIAARPGSRGAAAEAQRAPAPPRRHLLSGAARPRSPRRAKPTATDRPASRRPFLVFRGREFTRVRTA